MTTETGSRKEFCEKVLQTIETLGNNADEVAAKLRENNVVGYKSQYRSCPLANYLKKQFVTEDVIVGTSYIAVDDCRVFSSVPWAPSSVSDHTVKNCSAFTFIERFDEGHYPYLVKPKEHNDY